MRVAAPDQSTAHTRAAVPAWAGIGLPWKRAGLAGASPAGRLSLLARRRSIQAAVFVEAPLIVLALLFYWAVKGKVGEDFDTFRLAASAVRHGHSPYPPAVPALLALNNKFVYPPIDAYLLVPFTIVPRLVAWILFLLACCGAVALGLYLLGVRDWRCYSIALLTPPLFLSLTIGAISPFLFLGAAASWRYRDRVGGAALIVGAVVVAKLILWPLVVWLAATRRYRAAAGAAVAAVVFTVVPWAGIHFAGFSNYPNLLRALDDAQEWKSYSLQGLAISLGLPSAVGTLALALVAIGGTALIVYVARRRNGDERAFVIAILTALLATPLLWIHYLVLLFAPVAVARRRMSPLWGAPVLLWATPFLDSAGTVWRSAVLLGVVFLLGGLLLRRGLAARGAAGVGEPAHRLGYSRFREGGRWLSPISRSSRSSTTTGQPQATTLLPGGSATQRSPA